MAPTLRAALPWVRALYPLRSSVLLPGASNMLRKIMGAVGLAFILWAVIYTVVDVESATDLLAVGLILSFIASI